MRLRGMRLALAALAVIALHTVVLAIPPHALAQGTTRISGIGFPAAAGECVDAEGDGADFALTMTGDLEGCHYVYVETAVCTPAGTYRETGTETFVGEYAGEFGTFRTTYLFTAKYEDCPNLVGEIVGRCQHPIIAGSGRGVFEGVSGRLDFKDDIEAGNFPYRGNLRWGSNALSRGWSAATADGPPERFDVAAC